MTVYRELTAIPDWRSERAVAFDVRSLVGGSIVRERVFLPLSQCREQEGALFVSDWILGKKVEELVEKGFQGAEAAVKLIVGTQTLEESTQKALDFTNLRDFFDQAATKLATPKVAFAGLRLNRSGDRSKSPGIVHVTNGRGWDDPSREWYGSIKRDGSFLPTRSCPDDVRDFLVEFNADPVAVAASHGKNSGNCCFCVKELTQERSRSVGYGPVCAKSYQLPW